MERRGGPLKIHVPQRGRKRHLAELAARNAADALEQERVRWLADRGKTDVALKELQDALGLEGPPKRIECYDVSHVQGTSVVASMVVFEDALADAGRLQIPIVALAKEREELFRPEQNAPIVLPRTSQGLYLVQRIRDEAHRFAVTYHQNVRSKRAIRSVLDDVAGVGPAKKRALLRKFGS